MPPVSLHKIRNIGIIAHIDAGKTTTTERILYYTGKTHRIGEVHDGGATTDWMPQERERGITITSAAITCSWLDHQINIIDTPGHVDFTAEVERSLRVLDGAVGLFCAVGGVQPQSETVWRQAEKYHVPRIAFINKMDRQGADFYRVIRMMHERLGTKTLVLQLPIGDGDNFQGIIDLVAMHAVFYTDEREESLYTIGEIPPVLLDLSQEYRTLLIETLADFNDQIMEAYLREEPIKEWDLQVAIRKVTVANQLIPVLCGSAFKNKGVQPLLDAIVEYLPSPVDIADIHCIDKATSQAMTLRATNESSLSVLAFKLMADPHIGHLVFVRVYTGILEAGSYVYNATVGRKERVGRLVRMHANKREDVDAICTGDIGAVVGLKYTTTGHTLCSEDAAILLETMTFPVPVISIAIEPKTKLDGDKLAISLQKLAQEDPTFRVKTDEETGQTIISGMGELHLEVLVDRLRREFSVEATVSRPQVAYRESITRMAKGQGKFIRQTGGHGQYGHVYLTLEPLERGEGFKFVNAIVGGVIPREYIPAVETGVVEAMLQGVLAGYPVIDVKVTLTDGSYHDVDSSEISFKIAGSMAFKEIARTANPTILEPIMDVEVVIPSEYMGDVIGDLNSRRGKIKNIDDLAGAKVITATVPLSEMFGYATELRSQTSGRGTFSMQLAHYGEVPVTKRLELTIKL